LYSLSQKNDTDVAHYSFDGDQLILIIFGRDVGGYAIKRCLLSHLSWL